MLQDIRYALRSLRKTPGFVLIALGTLALGIGVNTAMFTVLKAVLLARLPYPGPSRLVQLWESNKSGGLMSVSTPNFQDWQASHAALGSIAYSDNDVVSFSGAALTPQRAAISSVSRDFFRVFETAPEIGRVMSAQEHREGASPTIAISHALWQSAFASDPAVLGRAVHLNGQSAVIVGVMPAGFDVPHETAIWIPAEIFPDHSTRSAHNHRVYGRLAPGVSVRSAQAAMDAVAARLGGEYIDDHDHGIRVVSLYDQIVGPVRPALLILMGAAGFVLLIACVNLANLQLARGSGRVREMALRAALGAARSRLIRQLLTESLVIAVAGGVAAMALAFWGAGLIRTFIPANIPRVGGIQIDLPVLLFTLAVSVCAGVLFGVLPAFAVSSNGVDEALRQGSAKIASNARQRRWGSALVATEIALAMVLLAGAGLLIRTFRNLESVDPGFASSGVLAAEIAWPVGPTEAEQARAADLNRRLLERVRLIPGVSAAGLISAFPIHDGGPDGGFEIAGRALPADPHQVPYADYRVATSGYFSALGIPLVAGHGFDDAPEEAGSPQVALVNEAFAREFFPQSTPLGHRIRFFGFDQKPQFMEIVGVVRNTRSVDLRRLDTSQVFVSGFQHDFSNPTLAVRGPLGVASAIRSAVLSVDPNVPVTVRAVPDLISESISRQRFQMTLLAIFAGLALVLSAIGIYGVQSYAVSRRTGELGIRLALGAQRRALLAMVLGEVLGVSAIGVAAGLFGSLLLARTLAGFLYNVSPSDPVTFASIAALLAAIALAAGWIPARRASRVDPLVALRYE